MHPNLATGFRAGRCTSRCLGAAPNDGPPDGQSGHGPTYGLGSHGPALPRDAFLQLRDDVPGRYFGMAPAMRSMSTAGGGASAMAFGSYGMPSYNNMQAYGNRQAYGDPG